MTTNADYGAVIEWIESVRRKFGLDQESNNGTEYWRGYEACLADLEYRVTAPPNDGSTA